MRNSPITFEFVTGLAWADYSEDLVGGDVGFSIVRQMPSLSWPLGASITFLVGDAAAGQRARRECRTRGDTARAWKTPNCSGSYPAAPRHCKLRQSEPRQDRPPRPAL